MTLDCTRSEHICLLWGVGRRHQAGEKRARLFGEHGTVQYEKGWCCWRIKSTAQGKSVRSLLQDGSKSVHGCWVIKGTGLCKKFAKLVGGKRHRDKEKGKKRNRAKQKGEKLMGENRQPAGQKGQRWLRGNSKKRENDGVDILGKMTPDRTETVHNCCGKNGAERDRKRRSWLMENRKTRRKIKVENRYGRTKTVRNCWGETAPGSTKNGGVVLRKTALCRTRRNRNCFGENDNSLNKKEHSWKRPSCFADKRNRAEKNGEKLIGGNRQPARQNGTALVEEKQQKVGE
ncbi:hypothetical protein T10_2505 [Trichinella papuae]|uniref:Uncharacterized protein n=1 Tax=Trichinella papuae TaxID=268474 RepID=A0A0V1M3T0_9BILA|nr:hypothetical protein T10_2505 [Trichinella papuae]